MWEFILDVKYEGRLHHHENAEAMQLLDNTGIKRRLQQKKKNFLS